MIILKIQGVLKIDDCGNLLKLYIAASKDMQFQQNFAYFFA